MYSMRKVSFWLVDLHYNVFPLILLQLLCRIGFAEGQTVIKWWWSTFSLKSLIFYMWSIVFCSHWQVGIQYWRSCLLWSLYPIPYWNEVVYLVAFLNHMSDLLDNSCTLCPVPVLTEEYVNEQGMEVNQAMSICMCVTGPDFEIRLAYHARNFLKEVSEWAVHHYKCSIMEKFKLQLTALSEYLDLKEVFNT